MEYTTNELSGSVEVCVIVTNPPFGHLLLFDIRLALTLVYGSAGTIQQNSLTCDVCDFYFCTYHLLVNVVIILQIYTINLFSSYVY